MVSKVGVNESFAMPGAKASGCGYIGLFVGTSIAVTVPLFREYVPYNPITKFIFARFLNFEEAFSLTWPYATILTFTGNLPSKFGDHPQAKLVFRDATKVAGVAYATFSNVTLGNTEIHYGTGHVASSSIKVICKTAIITSNWKEHSLENTALKANKICEPVARIPVLIEQDKQNGKLDNYTYFDYAGKIPEWLLSSGIVIFSKVVPQNLISEFIMKKLGVKLALDSCINLIFQTNQDYSKGVWMQLKAEYNPAHSYFHTVKTSLIIVSAQLGITLTKEFWNTLMLAPPVRLSVDGIDWLMHNYDTAADWLVSSGNNLLGITSSDEGEL